MSVNEIDQMFQNAPPAPRDDEPPGSVPRDRWGRPLVQPLDGQGAPKAYVRASSMAGALDDKTALGDWKARTTGRGVAMSPDLIAGFSALANLEDPENKKTAKELVEQAMERAGSSHKRTLGTALHNFTERFDRGERGFYVPEELHPVFGEYIRQTAGIQWLAIEEFGVLDDLEVAGTADRVGMRHDWAKPRVMDLKTGRVDFGQMKFAVQLYIYAAMKRYNPASGQRAPWPDIDLEVGHIIHADPVTGKVEIHDVDLVKGRRAAELAREVYDLRKDKKIMVMATPFPSRYPPPAPTPDQLPPIGSGGGGPAPEVQPVGKAEEARIAIAKRDAEHGIHIQRVMGNPHDEAARANGGQTIMQRLGACTTLEQLAALYEETGSMWNNRHRAFSEIMAKDIQKESTS